MNNKCDNCGKVHQRKKAKYCSNGCKQDAYRKRNNLDQPNFLKGTPKEEIKENLLFPYENFEIKLDFSKSFEIDKIDKKIINLKEVQNKLSNDMIFFSKRLQAIKTGKLEDMTLLGATIGSHLGTNSFNKILTSLAGGVVGYFLGEAVKMDKNEKIKQIKIISQKINEIDNSLKLVKKEISFLNVKKDEIVKELKSSINDVNSLSGDNTKKNEIKPTINAKKPENKIYTSEDVLNVEIKKIGYTGRFLDLIGNPSKGFFAIVFGLPKNGKSNLCFQWAEYSAEFGKTLYILTEETIKSGTVQDKIKQNKVSKFDFIECLNQNDFLASIKTIKKYTTVYIDSLTKLEIEAKMFDEIRAENPNISFVAVLQTTKKGQFKGSQEFAHNCDIIINVEKGIAFQFGRYNQGGQINIFED